MGLGRNQSRDRREGEKGRQSESGKNKNDVKKRKQKTYRKRKREEVISKRGQGNEKKSETKREIFRQIDKDKNGDIVRDIG